MKQSSHLFGGHCTGTVGTLDARIGAAINVNFIAGPRLQANRKGSRVPLFTTSPSWRLSRAVRQDHPSTSRHEAGWFSASAKDQPPWFRQGSDTNHGAPARHPQQNSVTCYKVYANSLHYENRTAIANSHNADCYASRCAGANS
jgi:hypothetical protein